MTSLNSIEEFADEQLLVREMAHRINNEFASAVSVVPLTAARSNSAEVKWVLAGVVDHLHSYARCRGDASHPAGRGRCGAHDD
jgi:two-component sensor histidine kinase